MAFSSAGIGREQGVSERDSAEIPAEVGRIRLCLLGSAVFFTDRRELLDAFRHRYVLAHYIAFTVTLQVMIYLVGLSTEAVGLLYMMILIGSAAALLAGWAYLELFARDLPANAAGPKSIRLEPGLVVGAMAVVAVVRVVRDAMGSAQVGTPGEAVGLFVLALIWLMLSVGFLMRRTFPRTLRRLRQDRETILHRARRAMVEREVVTPAPTREPEAMAEEPTAQDVVMDWSVLSSILRLEASGNYVTVVTKRGRKTVPGPFAAVVARMPREAGRQVHRSHWVARHAVVGDRRVGRDLRLLTVDGASVPVAAAKAGAVRLWLSQERAGGPLGVQQAETRPAGAGGT